jgi:four helix bundle protein
MSISLKEARESEYWITLLKLWWYLQEYQKYQELANKTDEMIWVLIKIIKTTKLNLQ